MFIAADELATAMLMGTVPINLPLIRTAEPPPMSFSNLAVWRWAGWRRSSSAGALTWRPRCFGRTAHQRRQHQAGDPAGFAIALSPTTLHTGKIPTDSSSRSS
jgi:hypothetical protein